MNPSNSRSALLASKATAVIKKRLQGGLLAIALLASWSGAQAGYSNLYVFGDLSLIHISEPTRPY